MRYQMAFFVIFVIGCLLTGLGWALDLYYKSAIQDKNNDGVVDWRDVDINNDGRVDAFDVASVVKNQGVVATTEQWRYDINGDGYIDEYDVFLVRMFFGMKLAMFNIYTPQGKLTWSGIALATLGISGLVLTRRW